MICHLGFAAAVSAPRTQFLTSLFRFLLSVSISCVSLFFVTIKYPMTHFIFVQLSLLFCFHPFSFLKNATSQRAEVISGIQFRIASHSEPNATKKHFIRIFPLTNFIQMWYILAFFCLTACESNA